MKFVLSAAAAGAILLGMGGSAFADDIRIKVVTPKPRVVVTQPVRRVVVPAGCVTKTVKKYNANGNLVITKRKVCG